MSERELLGNKGLNLTLLAGRGYPVPPFGVLTADQVAAGVDPGGVARMLDRLREQAAREMATPPEAVAFAVRSSPPVSMPGMMDTLLAVGLSPADAPALAARLGSTALAEAMLAEGAASMRALTGGASTGGESADPVEQVCAAVAAVRASWHNERARRYRDTHGIPEGLSPAVVVQTMAFGTGPRSGSGVVFSHDPLTGAAGLCGEYLPASTGTALVEGQVTPDHLGVLEAECPAAYAELDRIVNELFAWQQVMVEVEFVIEQGRLWLVQMRAAVASELVRTVVVIDGWRRGVIDRAAALAQLSIEALSANAAERAVADHAPLLASGVPASTGVAIGRVVRTTEEVLAQAGESVVLLRPATEPEDFVGMVGATGIVTLEGGFGSHAAVVARELGRPAVVGARWVNTDAADRDELIVTVCGTTGRVWEGAVPVTTGPALEWPSDLLGPAPAAHERTGYLETLLAEVDTSR